MAIYWYPMFCVEKITNPWLYWTVVEVREWMRKFLSLLCVDAITYPCPTICVVSADGNRLGRPPLAAHPTPIYRASRGSDSFARSETQYLLPPAPPPAFFGWFRGLRCPLFSHHVNKPGIGSMLSELGLNSNKYCNVELFTTCSAFVWLFVNGCLFINFFNLHAHCLQIWTTSDIINTVDVTRHENTFPSSHLYNAPRIQVTWPKWSCFRYDTLQYIISNT